MPIVADLMAEGVKIGGIAKAFRGVVDYIDASEVVFGVEADHAIEH
jgi:hypothetical protein